jgi:hypothetical protein
MTASAAISVPLRNVTLQNVTTIKRHHHKTSPNKTSRPQNVTSYKTSPASKHHQPQNVTSHKMSLATKRQQPQNVTSNKTSPATKRHQLQNVTS